MSHIINFQEKAQERELVRLQIEKLRREKWLSIVHYVFTIVALILSIIANIR